MPNVGDIYQIGDRSITYPSDNPRDNLLINTAFPPPAAAGNPKKQDPKKKLSNFDFEGYGFKPEDIPFLSASHDDTGHLVIKYSNPKDPKKSFTATMDHTGSYEGSENSGDKPFKAKLETGHKRSYTAEGAGSQVDGSSDHKTEDTKNENVGGDLGSATGKTRIEGTKDQKTGGTGGGTFMNDAAGDSVKSVTGDQSTNTKGSYNSHFTGHYMETVDDNYVLNVTNGDHAISVQSGNMDHKVSKQVRIKATKEITIDSDTKITLKVGKNSIIIDQNGIGIGGMSGGGFVNVYAEDTIVVQAFGSMAGMYAPNGTTYVSGINNVIRSSKGTTLEKSSVPPAGKVIPSK
jgi:hypothetical protein